MNYKFKSGATVEGTLEQILQIAKTLGETVELSKIEGEAPRGLYLSSKSGLMKIADMTDFHIRNAMLKRSKIYFENLGAKRGTLNNQEFLNEFTSLADDTLVTDLFTELTKRKK